METALETIDGLTRRITVDIEAVEVDTKVKDRLMSLSKTLSMDGFRKGKVPLRIVKQRFSSSVRQEVVGKLIEENLEDAIKKEDLQLATQADVQVKQNKNGEPLVFTAEFEIYPDMTSISLDEIKVEKLKATVSDKDIDNVIERWRRLHAQYSAVERPAQEGDRVTVDYSATLPDAPDNEKEVDQAIDCEIIIGPDLFLPELREQLQGVTIGQVLDFDVVLRKPFQDIEEGKTLHIHIAVKGIEEAELPTVDDAFCEKFGIEEGGVASLREDIRKALEQHLQEAVKKHLDAQLGEQLVDHNPIEVPKRMVQNKLEQMKKEISESTQGESDTVLTEKQERDLAKRAQRSVQLELLLSQLIKDNKIEPDMNRVQQLLVNFVQRFEGNKNVIESLYKDKGVMNHFRYTALFEKVFDELHNMVQVTESETTFDEVIKSAEKYE